MSATSSWNLTVILKSSTAPWASSWSPGITCPLGQQKPHRSQWAWPCTARRRLWTSWSEWLRCDPDLQRQHGHEGDYSRQTRQGTPARGKSDPNPNIWVGLEGNASAPQRDAQWKWCRAKSAAHKWGLQREEINLNHGLWSWKLVLCTSCFNPHTQENSTFCRQNSNRNMLLFPYNIYTTSIWKLENQIPNCIVYRILML